MPIKLRAWPGRMSKSPEKSARGATGEWYGWKNFIANSAKLPLPILHRRGNVDADACSCRHDRRCPVTCREVADFLMEYIDGTLPSAQRATFDRHLAVCPD